MRADEGNAGSSKALLLVLLLLLANIALAVVTPRGPKPAPPDAPNGRAEPRSQVYVARH
jgi:hypothetical protein